MRTAVCFFLLSAATAERTSLKGSSSSRDKVDAAAASRTAPKKAAVRSGSSKQLTIGDGSSLETTDMFYIKDESTECTVRYNGKSKTTKCMKITTSTLPNHADGPYCQNGFWDHQMTQYPDSMSTSCLCQRYECDMTCNDLCLSCEPEEKKRSYVIPLVPRERPDDDAMKCDADNNYGDGLALNGVALAKNDPFEELSGQNNIAPLDENGGHSTLQFTYHYHAIPTIFFECESGWDATNKVWATSAPNQDHSPQIGWGLDGYPIFGPFSEGGVVPTDLDDCYAHDHEPYGVHYHANFDGETQNAFMNCYRGYRADQEFDDDSEYSLGPVYGPNYDAPDWCPITEIMSKHDIIETSDKSGYLVDMPKFDPSTCKDRERKQSRASKNSHKGESKADKKKTAARAVQAAMEREASKKEVLRQIKEAEKLAEKVAQKEASSKNGLRVKGEKDVVAKPAPASVAENI